MTEEHAGTQGWKGMWVVDREHPNAESAVRYLASETTRVFGEVAGKMSFDEENPERSSVEATIEVSSLDTGRQRRDEDLLGWEDFLQAEIFPEITFRSTQVERSGGDRMVVGDLTKRIVPAPIGQPLRRRPS